MKTLKYYPILLFFIFCQSKPEQVQQEKQNQSVAESVSEEGHSEENEESDVEQSVPEAPREKEYTEFLQNALNAIKTKNEKNFTSNLRYFSAALEKDKITPENLSAKNRKLYTRCLYEALSGQMTIPGDLAEQAVVFLNYDMETQSDNIFSLGRLYDFGWGVKQSRQKAMQLYQKAAGKGHARAMYNVGNMYETGDSGVKDLTKAIEWYRKSAENGHEPAMLKLGSFYRKGLGVSKDEAVSHQWYRKAADKGDAYAQYLVGFDYDEGYGGVEINWKKAVKWYQKAADQIMKLDPGGYIAADAILKLGTFYYFGAGGVKQDIPKAVKLFRTAKKYKIKEAETYFQVIDDMKNNNYHTLNESQYGNRIYVTQETLEQFHRMMPATISTHGTGWGLPISFENNSGGALQIFPTEFTNNAPADHIGYTNFSSCSPMYNTRGEHTVSISLKKHYGRRAIGYMYVTGHFYNEDLNIKVPIAVCWKPQNEYK